MSTFVIPPVLRGLPLLNYMKKHAEVRMDRADGGPAFLVVVEPMHVFKKVKVILDRAGHPIRYSTEVIANLILPEGTEIYCDEDAFKRYSTNGDRKMRASQAVVHSMFAFTRPTVHDRELSDYPWIKYNNWNWSCTEAYDWMPTDKMTKQFVPVSEAYSGYDHNFTYSPGQEIYPKNGFSSRDTQCAGGIHFFLNLRDALYYS